MPKTNKNSAIEYRFLSPNDFDELYHVNLEAFSDYLVPLQMTKVQFENHITQNSVDLNFSVGAFANGKMVGFTLNGFGLWNGKKTAYDAGTGVIPGFRKKGIGQNIFEFLLPKLREKKIEQMLLEVLEKNDKAYGLYRKLGFQNTRRLLFFEKQDALKIISDQNIRIGEIKSPDWDQIKSFWDKKTSWQFSPEAFEKNLNPKIILGAFVEEKFAGYAAFYPNSGMIPQIAVDKPLRRKGIATALLAEIEKRMAKDKNLKFGNVDDSLNGFFGLLKRWGFKQTIAQIEMIKPL